MVNEKTINLVNGSKVTAYKLNNGNWCNSNNCTTEYVETEKGSQIFKVFEK